MQQWPGQCPEPPRQAWAQTCSEPATDAELAQALEANECAAYRSFFEAGARLLGKRTFSVHEEGRATLFMPTALREPTTCRGRHLRRSF